MRSKIFTHVKSYNILWAFKNKLKKFHSLKIFINSNIFTLSIILYIYDYDHAIFL